MPLIPAFRRQKQEDACEFLGQIPRVSLLPLNPDQLFLFAGLEQSSDMEAACFLMKRAA